MSESSEQASKEKLSVSEVIVRLRLIQQGLAGLVDSLHQNIQALDDDPDLGLDALELDATERARSLESEVKRLRNDIKTIKEALGDDEKKRKPTET